MAIPTFSIDGKPNPRAMYLCAFLIDSLYHGEEDSAKTAIADIGGQLLYFQDNNSNWLPGLLMYRVGTDVGIVLAGTTEWSGWASYGASSITPIPWKDWAAFVNIQFFAFMQDALTEIKSRIPIGSVTRWYITGHSMGGAVSLLLALSLIYDSHVDHQKVELMTFGEPKAIGRNFIPPPKVHFRIIGYRLPPNTAPVDGDFDPVAFPRPT